MNSVPNCEFLELHQIGRMNPNNKQHCFVFADLPDIDLHLSKGQFADIKHNGPVHPLRKEQNKSVPQKKGWSRVVMALCALFLFMLLLLGVPLGLQLRASSLLEARLAFIRRLLSEFPLVEGYWTPKKNVSFSKSVAMIQDNMVGAILWPIHVPCGSQYLDAVQLTLEGIDSAKRYAAESGGTLNVVENASEMEDTHASGMIGVLLGIDGGHSLGASLAVLRTMYQLGTRFMSLTSTECTTPWAEASIKAENIFNDESHPKSITKFGESVLREMNRLGILVDISSLSDTAMSSVLQISKAPVLLSHVAPLFLCNTSTAPSFSDHILEALQLNGGLFMINVESCGTKKLSVREAITHINHVRSIAGVDHVGLSGAPRNFPLLLAELARDRIWGNAAIKKLVGGNIVRVIREVEAARNRIPLSEELIPPDVMDGNAYCRFEET